jgi:hypothetical protein
MWKPAESLRGGVDEVLTEFLTRERVPAQVAPRPKRRKRREAAYEERRGNRGTVVSFILFRCFVSLFFFVQKSAAGKTWGIAVFLTFCFVSIAGSIGGVGKTVGAVWEPYRVADVGGMLNGGGGRCRVHSAESRKNRLGNGFAHIVYLPCWTT